MAIKNRVRRLEESAGQQQRGYVLTLDDAEIVWWAGLSESEKAAELRRRGISSSVIVAPRELTIGEWEAKANRYLAPDNDCIPGDPSSL